MYARITLALLPAVIGCASPPAHPAAADLFVASVNLTDEAPAFAIEASPRGNVAEWERRVLLVEHAREAVGHPERYCSAVDDLALVASLVACGKCLTVIEQVVAYIRGGDEPAFFSTLPAEAKSRVALRAKRARES